MSATRSFRNAVPNGCGAAAAPANRRNSAARVCKVAARRCASSVNEPKTPVGGAQAEKACTSVDVRLTLEFGKCSVDRQVGSALKTSCGKRDNVAYKTPAGDSHLPRELHGRARLRAELRGDCDAV